MRNGRDRLLDILEAIKRIERYAGGGRESVENDELKLTWIVYHMQIVGEAARKLSEPLRSLHPEVPWAEIIAMRNVLVQDYFGIDTEEVWNAVERDLPHLKRNLGQILGGLGEEETNA